VCQPSDFALKTSVIAARVSVENPASSKFIEMLPAVMFVGPMLATTMATCTQQRRHHHNRMIASAQPDARNDPATSTRGIPLSAAYALATYIATNQFFTPELDASHLVDRITKGHTP
jgi:hypothetical protein